MRSLVSIPGWSMGVLPVKFEESTRRMSRLSSLTSPAVSLAKTGLSSFVPPASASSQ